jgi:hypothetical protein
MADSNDANTTDTTDAAPTDADSASTASSNRAPLMPGAEPPSTHFSWGASLAIGVFVVGVIGALQIAPFWSLCWGAGAALAARFGLPDRSARLLALTVAEEPRPAKHQRLAVAGLFLAPLIALAGVWDAATPAQLWYPWALVWGVGFGFLVYAFAVRRGGGTRPQRWWWAWLPIAGIVVVFFAAGGPFRARWSYCESRLSAAVARDEPIERSNTGRFCWHDATDKTVDGQRRLYLEDGTAGSGTGFAYSPDRAIEQTPGLQLLRNLGNGWYYFEEGSALRDFWFDD